jgi:phage terminase large subunit
VPESAKNVNGEVEVRPTRVFVKNRESKKRIKVNQGSTGSSKTYSIIQNEIVHALQGEHGAKKLTSFVAATFPQLERGVITDFIDIMKTWGVYNPKKHHFTKNYYRFDNGYKIEFFALDSAGKALGARRDRLYVNECNLIEKKIFDQLIQRTSGSITIDYNPSDSEHWIYENIVPRDDCELIVSTYRDNFYLSDGEVQEIEKMVPVYKTKSNEEIVDWDLSFSNKGAPNAVLVSGDVNNWRVYGLGQRGVSEENIYTAFEVVDGMPDHLEAITGIDFGFNAPTSIVSVAYDEDTNELYWDELLYQRGLTNADLIAKMEELIEHKDRYIYGDSAEPARIEEIYKHGFNIDSSDKSVKDGIDFIKSCKLKITKRSVNLLKEVRGYKWKVDRMGLRLDEPVKRNDHALDGARYASYTHFGKKLAIGFF